MTATITQETVRIGALDCRLTEAPGGGTPVLYVHGVPNTGAQWQPFLERTGGIAPDLPGFGASDKPERFDYSIAGYAGWFDSLLTDRGIDHYRLVVHDWGGAVLAHAGANPERVERLVVMNAVPLLPGYRWHRIARIWRTPLIGELGMGLTLKPAARRLLADSAGPYPEDGFEELWRHFDHGTQRAILKLYRSAPPSSLEAAGRSLGAITCPALILWGQVDPYLDPSLAQDYADALGGPAEVDVVESAGHWPWHAEPRVVDRVSAFLDA